MDPAPILVLTLDGDDRRRAPLVRTLEDLGLDFELFLGIDGRDGLPAEYEPLVDRPGALRHVWKTLSDAEYACALSHQNIYKHVLDRNLLGAIILEDDAIIGQGFADFVRARGYLGREMALLGGHGGLRAPFGPKELAPRFEAYRVAKPPMGAYGYYVSNAGAAAMRRLSLPLRAPADWPCNIARLNCVALVPPLVVVRMDDEFSRIAPYRTVEIVPQKHARLRSLFSLDKWLLRLAAWLGRPLYGAPDV